MSENYEKFWVSQVGILIRDKRCLVLEFASHPGRWGLPGGRIDKNEASAEHAFRREILEELGFENFAILGIIGHETWYNPENQPVCAVAHLIKNNLDDIELSDEHISMQWIKEEQIDEIDFLWPCSAEFIKNGFTFNKNLCQN